MWIDIKTVAQEHLPSENVTRYLLTCYQQSHESQQTNEQTKVIQEVVSPEVSKLKHAEMNKKQADHMQFSIEKED